MAGWWPGPWCAPTVGRRWCPRCARSTPHRSTGALATADPSLPGVTGPAGPRSNRSWPRTWPAPAPGVRVDMRMRLFELAHAGPSARRGRRGPAGHRRGHGPCWPTGCWPSGRKPQPAAARPAIPGRARPALAGCRRRAAAVGGRPGVRWRWPWHAGRSPGCRGSGRSTPRPSHRRHGYGAAATVAATRWASGAGARPGRDVRRRREPDDQPALPAAGFSARARRGRAVRHPRPGSARPGRVGQQVRPRVPFAQRLWGAGRAGRAAGRVPGRV